MKKEKVLILTQNFYPVVGSAGNRMKNIFDLLNIEGIDADVLTIKPGYPNEKMYESDLFWDDTAYRNNEKIKRINLLSQRLGSSKFARLFYYFELMIRFIWYVLMRTKDNYTLIYVSSPPIFIVPAALLAKALYGKKIILEIRDLWPDSLEGVKIFNYHWVLKLLKKYEKHMYEKADAIIINSPAFQKHIAATSKVSDTKILYIPNGPRKDELQREVKDHTKPFSIIYAGNLGLAQNIDQLLLIFRALNDAGIVVNLLGYGLKEKEVKSFIKENGLKHVYIHQPTTRKKSLALISESHLALAFLTDEDVFSTVLPGKLLDYMTCKTPIIAGVRGESKRLIETSKTGFVFDPDEIDEMTECVIKLKNDVALYKTLECNCEKYISEGYVWEDNIKKICTLIHSMK